VQHLYRAAWATGAFCTKRSNKVPNIGGPRVSVEWVVSHRILLTEAENVWQAIPSAMGSVDKLSRYQYVVTLNGLNLTPMPLIVLKRPISATRQIPCKDKSMNKCKLKLLSRYSLKKMPFHQAITSGDIEYSHLPAYSELK